MKSIESLFEIHKGHQLALNRVTLSSNRRTAIAYVARSHRNNGIAAWVEPIDEILPAQAGDLSVCLRSRNHALTAFVQPRPFYTTYHVAILSPKVSMTLQEKLWWCLCIKANRFRFHFGRQANRTIGSLLLPDAPPDWATTMDIPSHRSSGTGTSNGLVDTSEWTSFRLLDLFDVAFGEHTTRRDLPHGTTPLVTASTWNNGITAHVAVEPEWDGGQITVANNGSIGAAFFQPRPFSASRDVTILKPKIRLSAAAALFVCAVLRRESERYNYARKWNAGRMRESTLRLPSKQGEPDFASMASLMRSLRLGWALPN